MNACFTKDVMWSYLGPDNTAASTLHSFAVTLHFTGDDHPWTRRVKLHVRFDSTGMDAEDVSVAAWLTESRSFEDECIGSGDVRAYSADVAVHEALFEHHALAPGSLTSFVNSLFEAWYSEQAKKKDWELDEAYHAWRKEGGLWFFEQ